MNYVDKIIQEYLKTFKVTKNFEFIGANGSTYRIETFKCPDYAMIVRRFNEVKQSWEYEHSCGYICNKDDLKYKVIANIKFHCT